MNPVINNIDNPEPQFMLHNELIYWLEKNMQVNFNLTRETPPYIVLKDGSGIDSGAEMLTVSASITINQQDVNNGAWPKTICSSSHKFLAVKNDRVMYGGSTDREVKIYSDLNRMAQLINKQQEEIQQLRGLIQSKQYPIT
jgi:hypothetical protein